MNQRGHLPCETLDLLFLAALPEPEAAAARAHLASCEACRAQYAQLEADAGTFQREVFGRTAPRVRERIERERWSPLQLFRLAPVLVVAGLVVAVVLPRLRPRAEEPDVLTKGAPGLQVYALRNGAAEPEQLTPNAKVSAGDRLRFVVEPAGYDYLLLVSVDGKGEVSAYYPPEGKASGRVEPGKVPLPGAIELDATPGTERLYAWFSRAPLELTAVEARLRADPDRPPDLPGALRLAFPLQKDKEKP